MSDLVYFLVLSNPTEGGAEEYNRWYSRRHITDVLLQVEGVRSVQRFGLGEHQRRKPPYAFQFMALYEVERDAAEHVFAELEKRSGTEVMPISDTFDRNHIALVFDPVTPKLTPATAAAYALGTD
ncbi:hypothetical protein [Sphingopyxis sp.]|uniref:hypothetical protein n=1 Tax=Sphingopyxis sp. TaxID=1908224 RepID=UPI002D782DD6|nr:hypothetical protein [Sphingopyxis sp.]HET6526362.1 hypothetical protein [Sphingopyxis sp.]